MASRDKLRPTPPPQGPALVRPVVGVLLVALGGAAEVACEKKGSNAPDPAYGHPPMAQPVEDPVPPMPPPPMPPPPDDGPDPVPPMPPPDDGGPDPVPPMPAPMPDPG